MQEDHANPGVPFETMKIITIFLIPRDNNENHENQIIPNENHNNRANLRIPL